MKTSKTTGNKQILLSTVIYDPSKTKLIHLRKFGKELAIKIGLTPIRYDRQKYSPHGETLILYLAESHICLETYPEHQKIEIEVASCRDFSGDALAEIAGKYGFAMSSVTVLTKDAEDQWQVC